MITIRDATEDDLPAIIHIYNQSIPAGRATADTKPISVADRTEWFRKFDPARRPIWVAEESGRVIGCVYLSWFYGGRPAYEKTAEISTYIASDHQGKGLGTLLKKRMIEACPRFGVETLISMYFDHNEATKRLNSKFGFEVVGHLPEIAEVFGKRRGLVISILRIKQGGQGCGPNALPRVGTKMLTCGFAETPKPPYCAVIFTSLRRDGDGGYGQMAERMMELARQQPGFLGVESVRGSDGLGITVSYWTSEEAVANWKAHAEHKIAQDKGRRVWYSDFQVRVARVERDYPKRAEPDAPPNGGPAASSDNSSAPGGPPSVS